LAGEAMILFHSRDDHLDVQIQRGPAVVICVGVKDPAYGRKKYGFLFGQVIIQFCDEVVEVVTDAEHGKIVLSVDGAHRIQKRTYFWYGLANESMMMFENEVDQLFRSPVFKMNSRSFRRYRFQDFVPDIFGANRSRLAGLYKSNMPVTTIVDAVPVKYCHSMRIKQCNVCDRGG